MAGPRSSSACAGLARRAVSESNHSRECTKPVSGAASRAAPASRAGAGAGGARVWPRAAGCERPRRTARSIAAPRVLHNRRPPGKHLVVFDRDLRTTRSGPRWVSLGDKYSSAGCERRGSLGRHKHFSSYQTASPRYLRFSIKIISDYRYITLGGKGRGAMAISSGERRSSASAGVSTRGTKACTRGRTKAGWHVQ